MDTIKHLDYFNSGKFTGSVGIIGLGALGSAVALEIAKLGVKQIRLYDFDKVVAHNISNQILYGPESIDNYKVYEAMATIRTLTGTECDYRIAEIGGEKIRHDYIFCCVDSMAARDKIFNNSIYMNFTTRLYIEGRMNAQTGYCYTLDPRDPEQVKQYLAPEIMYNDREVSIELGSCGVTPSIGATAHILAGIMAWQFIKAVKNPVEVGEVVFTVNPWKMYYNKFHTLTDWTVGKV